MPEPISILASCFSIAKVALSVSFALHAFIQGAKHVTQTIRDLQAIVEELIKTLEMMPRNLKAPVHQNAVKDEEGVSLWETLDETLFACQRTLMQMDDALVSLSDEGQSRFIRKIKLDYKESEIASFITRIQVHIGTLSLSIQMFTLRAIYDTPNIITATLEVHMQTVETSLQKLLDRLPQDVPLSSEGQIIFMKRSAERQLRRAKSEFTASERGQTTMDSVLGNPLDPEEMDKINSWINDFPFRDETYGSASSFVDPDEPALGTLNVGEKDTSALAAYLSPFRVQYVKQHLEDIYNILLDAPSVDLNAALESFGAQYVPHPERTTAADAESILCVLVSLGAKPAFFKVPMMPYAGERGFLKLIQVLLRNGVSLLEGDINGQTALHWAVLKGQLEAIKFMLCSSDSAASVKENDTESSFQRSSDASTGAASGSAGKRNALVQVSSLLRCSALIDARDNEEKAPLHIAVEIGNFECAKQLLDSGAFPSPRSDGVTPLHTAVRTSDVSMVDLLLAHKADTNAVAEIQVRGSVKMRMPYRVNLPFMQDNMTHYDDSLMMQPIHVAILLNQSVDIMTKLLENGAHFNGCDQPLLTTTGKPNSLYDHTPLRYATRRNNVAAVYRLISNGASMTLGGPLYEIRQMSHASFGALLKAGADGSCFNLALKANRDAIDISFKSEFSPKLDKTVRARLEKDVQEANSSDKCIRARLEKDVREAKAVSRAEKLRAIRSSLSNLRLPLMSSARTVTEDE